MLDAIDIQILKRLTAEGRLSISSLAREIGMSAPSVTERIRRMTDHSVIQYFTVTPGLPALGFAFEAIIRIKPRPGALEKVEEWIVGQQQFTACDKVTGDDCFIARLALRSIQELDDVLNPLHQWAETNTAIVKSSPIRSRLPI